MSHFIANVRRTILPTRRCPHLIRAYRLAKIIFGTSVRYWSCAPYPPESFPKLKREINRDTQRGWVVTTEKVFRTMQDFVREISQAEFAAMKKEDVIAERKIAKGITSDTFFRTTVLTGSASDENDSFYIGAVARNRSLWKITGKMEFHSTYK